MAAISKYSDSVLSFSCIDPADVLLCCVLPINERKTMGLFSLNTGLKHSLSRDLQADI